MTNISAAISRFFDNIMYVGRGPLARLSRTAIYFVPANEHATKGVLTRLHKSFNLLAVTYSASKISLSVGYAIQPNVSLKKRLTLLGDYRDFLVEALPNFSLVLGEDLITNLTVNLYNIPLPDRLNQAEGGTADFVYEFNITFNHAKVIKNFNKGDLYARS